MFKKILLSTVAIILIPSFVHNSLERKNITNNYEEHIIKVKQVSKNEIIELDLEDYIVGVVAGEMPVSFEEEALKAQAVVARTYALKRVNDQNEYDVVDTTKNQVYLDNEHLMKVWGDNYEKNIAKIRKAVSETSHECIFYDDKLIDALFFSTSVGMTENSEEIFPTKLPYLRSVSSTWDEESSPVYKESYSFTLTKFYEALGLKYNKELKIEKTNVTSTGRIKEIKINGVKFTGTKVQQLLNLRSNYFSISKVGEKVIIETKGYGHGVGMSQYGANGMAKEGYSYREIIDHYYQDIELKKI